MRVSGTEWRQEVRARSEQLIPAGVLHGGGFESGAWSGAGLPVVMLHAINSVSPEM